MEHGPGGIECGPMACVSPHPPFRLLAFLLLGGFCALLRFGVIRHVNERLDVTRGAASAARVGGGINIPPLQLPAQRAMEPAAHLAGAGVPA
jgi:hypothetical protein